MRWSVFAAVFCLITSAECSNPALRSHNNGPDWISDCYDHAPHHLMNPFCPTQGCLAPEFVAHAQIDYNITFYVGGSKVTYTCDPFYEMVGPPTITCIQDPTKGVYVWTPGPRCNKTVYECGPLPQISNGKHSETYNRTVNSTVAYTCDRGYKLIGQETVTCVLFINQSTATWSQPPSCMLDCGMPKLVMYANLTDMSGTLEGDVATYECQLNAKLVSDANVTCLHTGNWSVYPTCIPGCGEPPVVTNGRHRDVYNTTVNSTTAYTCARGYLLVGQEIITCSFIAGQDLPAWTTPPRCTKTCGTVPTVANATFKSPDSHLFGSSVIYTCNEGFVFITSFSKIDCMENGEWSVIPECNKANMCPEIPTIDHGSLASVPPRTTPPPTPTPDAGSTTDFPVVETTTTTVAMPTPVVTTSRPNGLSADMYEPGTSVTYQCNNGYAFRDTNSSVCQLNATWSKLPECVLDCQTPREIKNGSYTLLTGKTIVGSEALYTCLNNFTLTGDNVTRCLDSGNWSNLPECKPDCGELYDPNGNFSLGNLCNNSQCFCDINKCECGTEIYYNNTDRICNETNVPGFRLVCNERFQLVGDTFVQCIRNLTWTARPHCECIRKSADLVFMIDSSGSVGVDGFNQTKEFLISMMNMFPADKTRFGLLFFSDQVVISFHLKTFLNDTESMIQYIRNISYNGGATHTYEALQMTREAMFTEQNGMRLNASHIAILVSDGMSNDVNKTAEQARLLKESGVTVYAVGVGDFTDNQQELRNVASQQNYVFNVENYENIDEVSGPLADATCSVPT